MVVAGAFVAMLVLPGSVASKNPPGTDLAASVTAAGHLTGTYSWTIAKSASPVSQMVAVGSSASVGWSITTTKSASATRGAFLDGNVCVTNTGAVATQGLTISDQLTMAPSKPPLGTVTVDVSAMPALAAGAAWCYAYSVPIPAASITPGATYKDTANVTITNRSGHVGTPSGPSSSATAALPTSPTVVDGSVTVTDTNGQAFSFSSGGTVGYSLSYACDRLAGAQTLVETNTATIADTGQSVSAQATIHCGAPTTLSTALAKATIGQGDSDSDQATIGGAAATAGGTITYTVYSDATCTTQVADATPANNTVVNGVAPASKSIPFDTTGSYWWVAVYSGDASTNTLGSNSGCAAEPLTVQPNDFSIGADPSALSIVQGDSATSTISTAVASGSARTVALSVSGVPSGATAALDQSSVNAGKSATLTVNPGTAAPGQYTLTVTGVEGAASHSVDVTLTVKAQVQNDFSISASPDSLSLAQGASGTSTISTAVTSGSAEAVALSVSGLPAGASASFSPPSVTAGGSSTFMVDAGSAPAGDYTLMVTGAAASASHTTSVSLTVVPPVQNDFSISASPSSLTVASGASGTSTISTAVTSGSAEAVALSVSGLPSGASASFSPMSVTAGGSSTLTVDTGTATAGSYTLTVMGTAASATHTATVSLTISGPGSGGITNGGFESGSLSGWTASGASESVLSGGCHGGSFCARLGYAFPTDGNSTITQTFTVPADKSQLSLWYKEFCTDTVTYDWAVVALKDNTANTASNFLNNTCTNSGQWTNVTGAVTAGHSYTLTLTNHDDNYSGDPTYTLFDDVTLNNPSPLVNGGFESGSLSGWTASGASESVVSGGCHGGSFCARLGSTSPTNGDSTITQTFTVPAGATQLSLWYEESCPDIFTYDWAVVTLKDNTANTTSTLLNHTCTNSGQWTNVTGAVTAGHSYTLTLTSHDDNYAGDPTFTLFDDVTLN
jgi:hypothetical protein